MAMDKCENMTEVKRIAEKRGIKPGRVNDTVDGIQFTKGVNPRITVISWDEFEANLNKRGLAVYQSRGWLKIMKA